MESLSLSHSVINNLNSTMQSNAKINRHLQTGKRLIDPYDDAGGASALSRTNLSLLQNKSIQQNLQNSLSLLQAQDGALKVVGKILNRTSEIKSFFDSPTVNAAQKGMYNEEFRELQHELRDLAQSKWNGISLFSTNDAKTLFGPAVGTNDLMQESSNKGFGGELKLSRWGIYHVPPELDPPPLIKKKFLAMTLTDESWGSTAAAAYRDQSDAGGQEYHDKFENDIKIWKSFTESESIEAEIAVVVNRRDNSPLSDGGALPPGVNDSDVGNYESQGLKANIYRGGGRTNLQSQGPPPTYERAMEAADGLDFSLAMTRYSRTRDQLHLTANLVSAAREMENVLYTDFLGD